MELSNSRIVAFSNRRIVELVKLSNRRMVKWWSWRPQLSNRRVVQWWNDGIGGVFESSICRMV